MVADPISHRPTSNYCQRLLDMPRNVTRTVTLNRSGAAEFEHELGLAPGGY